MDQKPAVPADLPAAQLLAEWRSLLSDPERASPLPVQPACHDPDPVNSPFNTMKSVVDLIKTMPNGKSVGPDRLPAECLKANPTASAIFIRPLFLLFWHTGVVPSIWRSTYLHPIFKAGDPRVATNYRGLALMSHLRKTYEFSLMQCLERKVGPRDDSQHGFVNGRSIWGPIWGLDGELRADRAAGRTPQVLLVDFEKAYDKVDRRILWNKLRLRAGPDLRIVDLIRELTDDNHLQLRGHLDLGTVRSEIGLPQGSSLSPVLYSYFIDDLADSLGIQPGASCKLYADDVALKTSGFSADSAEMDLYISRLAEYARFHGFRISVRKTVLLGGPPVRVYGSTLVSVPDARYLGVRFDISGGLWEMTHAASFANASRAYRKMKALGFLGGGFTASQRLLLIKTFVLSRLEFGVGLPMSARAQESHKSLYDESVRVAISGLPSQLTAPTSSAPPDLPPPLCPLQPLADEVRALAGLPPFAARRDVASIRTCYQVFGSGVAWGFCREMLRGNCFLDVDVSPFPPPQTYDARVILRTQVREILSVYMARFRSTPRLRQSRIFGFSGSDWYAPFLDLWRQPPPDTSQRILRVTMGLSPTALAWNEVLRAKAFLERLSAPEYRDAAAAALRSAVNKSAALQRRATRHPAAFAQITPPAPVQACHAVSPPSRFGPISRPPPPQAGPSSSTRQTVLPSPDRRDPAAIGAAAAGLTSTSVFGTPARAHLTSLPSALATSPDRQTSSQDLPHSPFRL